MIDDNVCKQLSLEICVYIEQRKNDKEEQFLKAKPKKNKLGEVTNGAINIRLSALAKILGIKKEQIDKIDKIKKTKEQTVLDLQKEKYNKFLSLLSGHKLNNEFDNINSQYRNFINDNEQAHEPTTWLSEWSPKAKDISFATHVGKLTHSSSKSSSVLDTSKETDHKYLTTNTLLSPEIDTASANAASLPVADVLKISFNGISVLDCIKSNDTRCFEFLTDNLSLIKCWVENLKQAYDSSNKQTYFLSKQIYFPIAKHQYHLLMPLTSSSLAQQLYRESRKYWDDEQVEARKQKNESKYHQVKTINYPKKAAIKITQSNHSNASSLNGKRGGKIVLLPSLPPKWERQIHLSIDIDSIFNKQLAFILKEEVKELRNYLLVIKEKKLPLNKPEVHQSIITKFSQIVEELKNYVLSVNESVEMNWTIKSKLPENQQLLFEPWRDDEIAKEIKKNKDWLKELSQTFARWLNNQLMNKKLNLTPIQESIWFELVLPDLREFIAIQEIA